MVPVSFPSAILTTIFSTSFPLPSQTKVLHNSRIPTLNRSYHQYHCHRNDSSESVSYFKRYRHPIKAGLALASRGTNEGDNRALETVLRLYKAIKYNNLNELSDIIGEECLCVCRSLSTFQTFHGKTQVMEFFSSLITNLGNNFEFVVRPTLHHGMTVGVSWRLECNKTHEPVGRGFSFHMCHVYQGKVLIRNVEMFMEPFLHIEPLKLVSHVKSKANATGFSYQIKLYSTTQSVVGSFIYIMGQMASGALLKCEKRRVAYIVCSLILFAVLFFCLKHYWS